MFDYVSSQVSLDVISSITLMRCEETFIDKIEKLIIIYEKDEDHNVLQLLEYEKDKKNEDEKLKFNETYSNKINKKNSFQPTMTPKRGTNFQLALESPVKQRSSMEDYKESSEVSKQLEFTLSNSNCNSNRISETEGNMSSIAQKKSGFSKTNISGMMNSPSKKMSKCKTIFPDEISKTPTKMLNIPIPEVNQNKKTSAFDVRK
jgi:hypothetical protein